MRNMPDMFILDCIQDLSRRIDEELLRPRLVIPLPPPVIMRPAVIVAPMDFRTTVELTGHWITVQRLARKLRTEPGASNIRIVETYSKHSPKRTVVMRINHGPMTLVKIDKPDYPKGSGHGAQRARKRRQ